MDLLTLTLKQDARISKARSIARVMDTSQFENAWAGATPEIRERVAKVIESGDLDRLKAWLHRFDEFDDFTLRDLRALASRYHISYYSRLLKGQLVAKLIDLGANSNRTEESSLGDVSDPLGGGSSEEADRDSGQKPANCYPEYCI